MRHLLFVNFCFVSVRRKLAQDGHQKDGEVWTAVPDDSTVYRKSDDDEASRIRRMHREEIRRITEAGNYTLWEQLARQHRIDANKAPDGLDFDDEFANAQEGTVSDLEEESAAAAQNMTAEERIAWEAEHRIGHKQRNLCKRAIRGHLQRTWHCRRERQVTVPMNWRKELSKSS
eukprot:gnl/TRDRNA2_/TRDRNA2_155372_c0_seq2.p1 gnl/TRDRNA2_/TRDRNA2_155372_c0~~gnl/TRDRNA2_/TRDRNA2_155372_c0_seq2.p1  ORF type:complete len:174 (-),score=23.91 gnl/TRDRNA2_/TRDRNA2_155372_c0_seq2:353-874(-)